MGSINVHKLEIILYGAGIGAVAGTGASESRQTPKN